MTGQDIVKPFVEIAISRETNIVKNWTATQNCRHGLEDKSRVHSQVSVNKTKETNFLCTVEFRNMGTTYLECTVLIASDLMVAVTVTVKGGEHNTEGSSPLAEENEEMMPQRLLREEEAPVVDCTDGRVRHKRLYMTASTHICNQ